MTGPAFSIVHISDLHFGKSFLGQQGFEGASLEAARQLEVALEVYLQKARPRRAVVAVTGDLTLTGDAAEFALALTYLRDRLRLDWSMTTGLASLAGRFDARGVEGGSPPFIAAVAGNHDHWNGNAWSTFSQRSAPAVNGIYLRGEPAWLDEFAESGVQLQLMGLDSTVAPGRRFLAQGAIDPAQIGTLARRIESANAVADAGALRPVRVLLCHHSRAPDIDVMHGFAAGGAGALAGFARQNGVHAVLSGHAHSLVLPTGTHLRAGDGQELRSGTTMQGGETELSATAGQSFIVHEIWHDGAANGSGVLWLSRVFRRTVGAGQATFRPTSVHTYRLA